MRKSKFTDAQVEAILRRGDRDPMAVVAKRHGVSEQKICCWCPAAGHLHSQVR
jgi:putative transposase